MLQATFASFVNWTTENPHCLLCHFLSVFLGLCQNPGWPGALCRQRLVSLFKFFISVDERVALCVHQVLIAVWYYKPVQVHAMKQIPTYHIRLMLLEWRVMQYYWAYYKCCYSYIIMSLWIVSIGVGHASAAVPSCLWKLTSDTISFLYPTWINSKWDM
jgi:hypothetical protein